MSKDTELTSLDSIDELLSLDDKIEWAAWKVKMELDYLNDLRKEKRVSELKTQTRGELDVALARGTTLTEEEALSSSRQRHQELVLDEIFHTSGVSSTPDSGPELQGYGDKHG
jgi:hypothetical protein